MLFDEAAVKTASTASQAAGMWWANALHNPKFDNGDTSPQGGVAMALATMGAPQQSEDALRKFATLLGQAIDEKLAKADAWVAKYGLTLSVDYHPDALLHETGQQAGLEQRHLTTFPWKTTMWVMPDKVSVRAGYGVDEEIVWSK